MKLLIDILHPAHVHFFRHFHAEMRARGHQIRVTAREKECTLDLLDRSGMKYDAISKQQYGAFGLGRELISRTARAVGVIRNFKPDVLTGIMGPTIALAGQLTRVPAVVFYDTEIAKRTNSFVYPLSHAVCTPDVYLGKVGNNHVPYKSFQELAYLHPNRFTPDERKLASFHLQPGEPFSVLRFVSWQASHDIGSHGLSNEGKKRIVAALERFGRVLISSEGPLPEELEPYRSSGPIDDIHHLLAFAQIFVGDSGTMSTEAACVGTHAVVFMPFELGNFVDLEQTFHLLYRFLPEQLDVAIDRIETLLANAPRTEAARKRAALLASKLDTTAWMVDWFEANIQSRAE